MRSKALLLCLLASLLVPATSHAGDETYTAPYPEGYAVGCGPASALTRAYPDTGILSAVATPTCQAEAGFRVTHVPTTGAASVRYEAIVRVAVSAGFPVGGLGGTNGRWVKILACDDIGCAASGHVSTSIPEIRPVLDFPSPVGTVDLTVSLWASGSEGMFFAVPQTAVAAVEVVSITAMEGN